MFYVATHVCVIDTHAYKKHRWTLGTQGAGMATPNWMVEDP